VCQHAAIQDALVHNSCNAVVSYHTSDGQMVAFEELKTEQASANAQLAKRLDPNAKVQAVSAVIEYHIKLNRAIFLYDKEGDLVFPALFPSPCILKSLY